MEWGKPQETHGPGWMALLLDLQGNAGEHGVSQVVYRLPRGGQLHGNSSVAFL